MSTDNELFDFGFTLVDENELEAVQKAQETVASSSESANATQDRLDKLFGAYPTTSEQFKKNPEKEYILWLTDWKRLNSLKTTSKKSIRISNDFRRISTYRS